MTPEFSRLVRIDTIGEVPRAVTIEAEAGERDGLAERFGLLALDRLVATATLVRDGEAMLASGRVQAEAVQPCVASAEPVPATIDAPFELRFTSAAQDTGLEEIELSENELDELTYEGGAIDLGEAVAQTFALALDPFPRAADAEDWLREAGVVNEEDLSPFAVLKQLRDRT